MAKIIAVMNEKGGVGKSATATILASLLAKRGKRTALIDFDDQGHSSIIYGVNNINKLEVTINTLLRKIMEDEPLPEPDSYVLKHESGVEVIPSNSQLFYFGEKPLQCRFPGTNTISVCGYHSGQISICDY